MKYLTSDNQDRATKSIVIQIRGNPIPLKRHRTYNNVSYDSQKKLKEQIGWLIKNQVNSYLIGNLFLDIVFYFEIPSSWSRCKKEKVAAKRKGSRPDLSNLIKFYEDVMQDVGLYKDDSQIVDISSKKLYDDGQGARVEITLKEVNETCEGGKAAYAKKETTKGI